jgi:SAM-dependent methyltransferase
LNLKGSRPEKFGSIKAFFYRRWGERSLEPLYRRVAAEIPVTNGKLLDIGCGPGKLDRLIAESRPRLDVLGLDGSEAMIRQARQGRPLPNLEFREAAVENAGFQDAFDFAFTLLSFHHWEEPVSGLNAVWAALKPGGMFWIYELDPQAPIEAIRADDSPLWGWLRLPEWFVRKGIRGHGFTRAEVDTVIAGVVAQTSFRTYSVQLTGATQRISLVKTP